MCGRFTLRTPLPALAQKFHAEHNAQLQLPLRYNVAPTQDVASVRRRIDDQARELVLLHWGLVPFWAKDTRIGNRMINARAESVASKPAFRTAFRKRRCLILSDGYYEWQKKQDKTKQPYYIHHPDHEPFAMAGLWEQWGPKEEPRLESCTIITTDANDPLHSIHDRMPVILDPQDYDFWLDPDVDDPGSLQSLLTPADPQAFVAEPVSVHVNNPRHEDAKCIEPVEVQSR